MDVTEIDAAAAASMGGEFRVGDLVTVALAGSSEYIQKLQPSGPHQERVREDGNITLPLIGDIKAAGRTPGQMQKDIHDRYVPRYFNDITVTVSSQARYFYVDGEIKGPGPKEYPGDMTIVKAISAAGGFTDFAKRWKVRLTRVDGHSEIINVDKAIENPELDVPVYPGDKIHVPRRIF